MPEDQQNQQIPRQLIGVTAAAAQYGRIAPASWSPFEWTLPREQAAELLILDELPALQIAERVGVGRGTLLNWQRCPEFAQRVAEGRELIRQEIRGSGLAIVENRIKAKIRRHAKLEKVIDARAEAAVKAQEAGVEVYPGETTGLVVRKRRSVGSGENTEIFDEVFVDEVVLRELRAHEVEIAQELGQWKADEPSHVVVNTDKAAVTLAQKLSPAELEELALKLGMAAPVAEIAAPETEGKA